MYQTQFIAFPEDREAALSLEPTRIQVEPELTLGDRIAQAGERIAEVGQGILRVGQWALRGFGAHDDEVALVQRHRAPESLSTSLVDETKERIGRLGRAVRNLGSRASASFRHAAWDADTPYGGFDSLGFTIGPEDVAAAQSTEVPEPSQVRAYGRAKVYAGPDSMYGLIDVTSRQPVEVPTVVIPVAGEASPATGSSVSPDRPPLPRRVRQASASRWPNATQPTSQNAAPEAPARDEQGTSVRTMADKLRVVAAQGGPSPVRPLTTEGPLARLRRLETLGAQRGVPAVGNPFAGMNTTPYVGRHAEVAPGYTQARLAEEIAARGLDKGLKLEQSA